MTAQGAKRASRPRPFSMACGAAAILASAAAPSRLHAGSLRAWTDRPTVSADLPDDAPMTAGNSFAIVGNFAWRAFIALNWPSKLEAAERGLPDREKALGDPGKRVWETFKSDYELFELQDDGRPTAPAPWASYSGANPCGVDNRIKTIAGFVPFAEFNQPSFAAGEPGNPLVAQNGAYTRFEIHFNEAEFSTIAGGGWSQGRNLPDLTHPARFPVGSIAVKAAWRPLTAAEAPAARDRYYVERAEIVDVAKTLAAGRVVCSTQDVALVGLHIVIKTKSRRQWVWSTFEHVDNVPPRGAGETREPDARDAGARYSYFDPVRPMKLWPPLGSPGTLAVSWTNPPKLDPSPMQVVRRYPIHASTMALNKAYWALPGVKGTVFEHYMLVAAQWPTSADPPGPENDGAFFPGAADTSSSQDESYRATAKAQENLVNTTMETYLQDLPSSCMACHQILSNAHGLDFVGILSRLR